MLSRPRWRHAGLMRSVGGAKKSARPIRGRSWWLRARWAEPAPWSPLASCSVFSSAAEWFATNGRELWQIINRYWFIQQHIMWSNHCINACACLNSTQSLLKFMSHCWDMRADRQTYRHARCNRPTPLSTLGRRWSNNNVHGWMHMHKIVSLLWAMMWHYKHYASGLCRAYAVICVYDDTRILTWEF